MGERGYDKPTDAAKAGWRTSASGNQITDPGLTKREDGWPHKSKVPHEELNWWQNLVGALALWMTTAFVREFADMGEALEATATQDRFRVDTSSLGSGAAWQAIFEESGAGGALAVVAVCTDGWRCYYAQADHVYAGDSADGSHVTGWDYDFGTGTVTSVDTDGNQVYATLSATNGVRVLDPADGTSIRVLGSTVAVFLQTKSNGKSLIAHGGGQYVYMFANVHLGETYNGTYDHGATETIDAIAIGADRFFLAGSEDSSTWDIKCVSLSSGADIWKISFTTISTKHHRALATDGERLVLGHDRTEVAGSTWASVSCYSAYDGSVLWQFDLGVNITEVGVDDRYVYASDGAATYVVDKVGGWLVTKLAKDEIVHGDGQSVYGRDGNNIGRIRLGGPPVEMYHDSYTNVWRRPYFNRAVPVLRR